MRLTETALLRLSKLSKEKVEVSPAKSNPNINDNMAKD